MVNQTHRNTNLDAREVRPNRRPGEKLWIRTVTDVQDVTRRGNLTDRSRETLCLIFWLTSLRLERIGAAQLGGCVVSLCPHSDATSDLVNLQFRILRNTYDMR